MVVRVLTRSTCEVVSALYFVKNVDIGSYQKKKNVDIGGVIIVLYYFSSDFKVNFSIFFFPCIWPNYGLHVV